MYNIRGGVGVGCFLLKKKGVGKLKGKWLGGLQCGKSTPHQEDKNSDSQSTDLLRFLDKVFNWVLNYGPFWFCCFESFSFIISP